jgi:hypothetical protein
MEVNSMGNVSADWLDLEYKPALPQRKDMGIGIIGAADCRHLRSRLPTPAQQPGQPYDYSQRLARRAASSDDRRQRQAGIRELELAPRNADAGVHVSQHWYATYRFDGTEGIIKGTNGSLYNYPTGGEDTLSYHSKLIHPDYWFEPRLHGKWFPHAFMGTMGELMRAIEESQRTAFGTT